MFAVDVSGFMSLGYATVEWDDTGVDPDFYAWRIYRREVGDSAWTSVYETVLDDPSFEIHDWLAWPNQSQEWALVQVTLSGAPGATPTEGGYTITGPYTPYDENYRIIYADDEAFNVKLRSATSHENADNYEQSVMPIIGRGYHMEQGTSFGETGTVEAQFTDQPGETARQQRQRVEIIKALGVALWLRSPFGDVKQVGLGQLSFSRDPGVGLREHGTMSIPYTEVN